MFYHAIHGRLRLDGTYTLVLFGFSQESGHPPQAITDAWQAMRSNPRIGEEYTNLQRFVDNAIIERFQLPHPDEGAQAEKALRAAEAERAEAERKGSVHEVLRILKSRGLTVDDLASKAHAEEPAAAALMTRPEDSETPPDPPAAASDSRTSRLKKPSVS